MKAPFITIDVSDRYIDREQFWRDAEAAGRLMTRPTQTDFLLELCQAKAWQEVNDSWLTDARAGQIADSITRELWNECVNRGLCEPSVRAIQLIASLEP
jgi:hypothetical protein